jgi:hypothetical protein
MEAGGSKMNFEKVPLSLAALNSLKLTIVVPPGWRLGVDTGVIVLEREHA